MKNLMIIGAGGFGREVLQYALDVQESGGAGDWRVRGFLDDNADSLSAYACGFEILGAATGHVVRDENVYICAIGDVKTKLAICRAYADRGARFINLIHPTATIGRTCTMGVGNILCPFASLTTDVTIGSFVTINQKSTCAHDAVVGDGCTLSSYCDVTGFATLGEGVFLGSHALVCPGVTVANYVRVGAGSVLLHNAKEGSTVFGLPAKKMFS